MSEAPIEKLLATLDPGPDHDAEELARLTDDLREQLLDLDVEKVSLASEGEAPAGAKGAELIAAGGLAVQLAPTLLRSVTEVTVAWLGRQQGRSVKLSFAGDTLELTGVSSQEQSRLIEQWVARHVDDG